MKLDSFAHSLHLISSVLEHFVRSLFLKVVGMIRRGSMYSTVPIVGVSESKFAPMYAMDIVKNM